MPTFANAMRHETAAMPLTTLELPLPSLTADQISAADQATAGLAGAGMLPGSASDEWKIVRVRAGQSLADIFHELGLSPTDLQRVVDAKVDNGAFRRIHPGDEFAFKSVENRLSALRFDRDDKTRVVATMDAKDVRSEIVERELERRVHVAHGTITSSLFKPAIRPA